MHVSHIQGGYCTFTHAKVSFLNSTVQMLLKVMILRPVVFLLNHVL